MNKYLRKFLSYKSMRSRDLAWLVSYPKSGNTKVRLAIAHYAQQDKIGSASDDLYSVISRYAPEAGADVAGNQALVIKTHRPGVKLIVNPRAPAVGIIRDPAEVIQSYRKYMNARNLKAVPMERLAQQWMHTTGWIIKNADVVLIYNAIVNNDESTISRLAVLLKFDTDRLLESFKSVSSGVTNPRDGDGYEFHDVERSKNYLTLDQMTLRTDKSAIFELWRDAKKIVNN